MAKKSDRVIRREQKKAAKQVRNMSRQKPKGVIEKPKDGTRTFPYISKSTSSAYHLIAQSTFH